MLVLFFLELQSPHFGKLCLPSICDFPFFSALPIPGTAMFDCDTPWGQTDIHADRQSYRQTGRWEGGPTDRLTRRGQVGIFITRSYVLSSDSL